MTLFQFIIDLTDFIWILVGGLSIIGCVLVYLMKDEIDYQIYKRRKK